MATDAIELARKSQAEFALGAAIYDSKGGSSFVLRSPTVDDLDKVITDFIGSVDLAAEPSNGQSISYGGIKRKLPLRHGYARNMFITAISEIRGVGTYAAQVSQPDIFVPVLDSYPLYGQYEIKAEFTAPLYNIFPDSSIKTEQKSYFNALGARVYFNFSNEWIRYVDWVETPSNEVLTSKYGQMVFQTSDNAAPGSASPLAAAHYQGNPFQTLPNSTVKITWFRVPLRFITSPNSFLRNCPIGVINQFDFFDPSGNGEVMYKKGTLQYGGYTHKHYNPPVATSNGSFFGLQLGIDSQKLCDVEMTFLRTNRDRLAERVPTDPPSNLNWLMNGWNLGPWLQIPNRYFYSHMFDQTSPTDPAKWCPPYNSFPFELFFTNPDAPQPNRAGMIEVAP